MLSGSAKEVVKWREEEWFAGTKRRIIYFREGQSILRREMCENYKDRMNKQNPDATFLPVGILLMNENLKKSIFWLEMV